MASASLGSLVLELAASTAKFSSDLGRAAVIAQNQARRISRALSAVGVALPVAGITAMATALVAGLVKAAKFGDEIRKASAKTGATTTAIQELAFAAKQSDVDLGSLTTALKKMQVSLSEAGTGAKQPLAALTALGLKLSDLQKLSPDVQFERIGDAISRLKDPADRARAATELFGRAGADLLPIFENGAGAIRKMRKEAEQIGAVLSDKDILKLAEANASITKFTTSFTGLWHTVAALATPALAKFFDVLRRGLGGSTERELEIEKLQRQLLGLSGGASKGGAGAFSRQANAARIEQLTAQIRFLQAGAVGAVGTPHTPTTARGHALSAPPGFVPDAGKAAKAAKALSDASVAANAYLQTLDNLSAALARDTISQSEYANAVAAATEVYAPASDTLDEITLSVERLSDGMDENSVATRNNVALINQYAEETERFNANQNESAALYAATRTAAEQYAETLKRLNELLQIGPDKGGISWDTYVRAVKQAQDQLDSIANTIKEGLHNAFEDMLNTGKFNTRSLVQFMIAELSKKALFNAIDNLVDAIAKIFKKPSGGIVSGAGGGFLDAIMGGLFASGGRPPVGKASIVGEKGPEWFVPDSPGTVIPHGMGGGTLDSKFFGAAKGADFTVGGRSGVDTNVAAFRATRGERVVVTPPGKKSKKASFEKLLGDLPGFAKGADFTATKDARVIVTPSGKKSRKGDVSKLIQRLPGFANGADFLIGEEPIAQRATRAAAKGADFKVGGRSGIDTNVVAFRATRGERVVVTPAGKKSKKTSFEKLLEGLPGFARGADFTVGGVKDKESTRDKVATISKSGTDFTVTGRSGVDANVVAFRATKGERVVVTPPGQKRRSHLLDDLPGFAKGGSFTVGDIKGMDVPLRTSRASRDDPKATKSSSAPVINYSPIYHIAPGVTRQELLPLLQRTHQQSISDISELIRRGRFA